VTNAATTPPTRQKNFVMVWNMANRGTFPHPIEKLYPGDDVVDIVGSQFYDRCPPLPAGDEAAWQKKLTMFDKWGNPGGMLRWMEWAKRRGKKYATPEWGVGGPEDICRKPGIDNAYFVRKMFDFYRANAANVAFEAYFNGHGFANDRKGSHMLFAPGPAAPAPGSAGYLAYVHRYNPLAASAYRTLWGGSATASTP
jgi:hypothetical protein